MGDEILDNAWLSHAGKGLGIMFHILARSPWIHDKMAQIWQNGRPIQSLCPQKSPDYGSMFLIACLDAQTTVELDEFSP